MVFGLVLRSFKVSVYPKIDHIVKKLFTFSERSIAIFHLN